MKKSILLIILVLLASAQSFAQHFDWVRGYAPGDNVAIVGSVTDSVGNLYILGIINFNTCWENGSRLLPIAPYGNARDLGDALIAKISPDGDLLWHKVIHGETANGDPHDIKLVGDTAFACLVTVPLASEMGYLYYLDTLIRKGGYGIYPDYPMSGLYIATGGLTVTALITFDFDGNVLEQHFLWMSYLDYNGDDIVRTYTQYPQPWYQARTFDCPSFAIDNEGNIYLSRQTYDMISAGQGNNYYVENGTISAIKIWCDRRVVGVVPADSNLFLSPQILKFSPHFDTLLNARFLYQNRVADVDCWETKLIYHAPHIYARFRLVPNNTSNLIVFDSTNRIQTRMGPRDMERDVIIKYDSSLAAVNSIILEDTITNPYTFSGMILNLLNDIVFDSDSNLAIVSFTANKSGYSDTSRNADNSYFLINGNVVDFHRNAGIIIMDEETLELKHTGQFSTSNHSTYYVSPGISSGNLRCSNNRVFTQTEFFGEVHFPNQVFQAPPMSTHGGVCLGVFDYQGNIIGGMSYHAFSTSYTGGIDMKDSILYLMNRLSSDATFGDIYVPSRGSFFACIAKYTDPAFMQPYRPEDTTMVVEVVQEEVTVVRYPNPTTGRLTIDMNGRPLREAWVAAIDGVAEPLPVTHLGDSRYAADLTGRPDGTYILILVADDHRAYRSTIILQH
jgi:hypothetical protein